MDMTARLLPHKELIAMLCRRCYGETPEELAKVYRITAAQVSGLIKTHEEKYKNMQGFLARSPGPRRAHRPKPKPMEGVWRNCLKCDREFFTTPLWRVCKSCHDGADYQGGTDFKTTAWRGAG